jgi:hypothetical protein
MAVSSQRGVFLTRHMPTSEKKNNEILFVRKKDTGSHGFLAPSVVSNKNLHV